jgi:hypothetical protein
LAASGRCPCAAAHAPLIVSFLHKSFIQPNIWTLPQQELVSRLEDHFFHLREQLGADAFPKAAADYLDDQAFLENRRIMQLIREIEQHALAIREALPAGGFMEIDDPGPEIDLPMDRLLYSPPFKAKLSGEALLAGTEDIPADALYRQTYVDKTALAAQIRRNLQTRPQISLAELIRSRPIQQSLAEVIAYLSLASEDRQAVIDDRTTETLT